MHVIATVAFRSLVPKVKFISKVGCVESRNYKSTVAVLVCLFIVMIALALASRRLVLRLSLV